MSVKEELQQLNNKLDKCRHKLAAATERNDASAMEYLGRELSTATKRIDKLKSKQAGQVSSKNAGVKALAFNRVLTKAEQGDMGKLKKSVRGLVVVHPLTAQGREMGLKEVTGYSPKPF